MKIYHHLLYTVLLLTCLLSACGPKDIGEGSSGEYYNDSAREPSSSTAEHSRYPVDGNNVQKRLFLLNQPAVQGQIQDRQRNFMNRRLGVAPGTPSELKVPKQASPFREF